MRLFLLTATIGSSVMLFAESVGGFTIPDAFHATAEGVIATLLTVIVVKLGPNAVEKFFIESTAARLHDSVEREKERLGHTLEVEKLRDYFDVTLKFLQEYNSKARKDSEAAMMAQMERLERGLVSAIDKALHVAYFRGLEDRRKANGNGGNGPANGGPNGGGNA